MNKLKKILHKHGYDLLKEQQYCAGILSDVYRSNLVDLDTLIKDLKELKYKIIDTDFDGSAPLFAKKNSMVYICNDGDVMIFEIGNVS